MFLPLQKFALLDPGRQLLLLGIWLQLGWTRHKLLSGGLSRFTSGLTLHRSQPAGGPLPRKQLEEATELGRLVALAARYTPWQSSCLTQVLVLQQMLQRRHIPGYFSLGVRTGGADESGLLGAHAWLQCGDLVVNGASLDRVYTTLSTFSWGDCGNR